jgi:hypothetical protein
MSLAAAKAMDDLADSIDEAAEDMPAGQGYAVMRALANAHRSAAAKIRAWAQHEIGGPVEVPPEYRDRNGAGSRR